MGTTSKVILATTIGTIVGAAAGILLAPKSGKETREDLSDKMNDLKDQLDELTDKSKQVADDLKQSVKDHHEELNGSESGKGSNNKKTQSAKA